jgi:CDGSH-type Zn-finger protein
MLAITRCRNGVSATQLRSIVVLLDGLVVPLGLRRVMYSLCRCGASAHSQKIRVTQGTGSHSWGIL